MSELSKVSRCIGKAKALLAAKQSPVRKGSQKCLSVRWVTFSSLSLCSKFFSVALVFLRLYLTKYIHNNVPFQTDLHQNEDCTRQQ